MNSCKHCGKDLVKEANFCIFCGKEVQAYKQASKQENNQFAEDDQPQDGKITVNKAELNFFESGADLPPSSEWKYSSRFPKEKTRYINCTISLKHPPAGENRNFELVHFIYGPDDNKKLFTSGKDKFVIGANYKESNHTIGCGWEIPGNWDSGKYFVEITMNNEVVSSGIFEIS